MSDLPIEDQPATIKEATGTTITAEVITAYASLYWAVREMERPVTVQYLERYTGRHRSELLAILFSRIPHTALWCAGYRVEIDPDEAFGAIFQEATHRFFQTTSWDDGEAAAKTAQKWANIAATADDRRRGKADIVAALIAMVKDIQIGRDPQTPVSCEDIK